MEGLNTYAAFLNLANLFRYEKHNFTRQAIYGKDDTNHKFCVSSKLYGMYTKLLTLQMRSSDK